MRVMANVGNGRYMGELVKENPLTVVMKLDPEGLIKELRSYFMEHGISMRSYREMLKEHGITRNGIIKRHKIKHMVRYC